MNKTQYLTSCDCGNRTTKAYARAHGGRCKQCVGGDAANRSERDLRIMETYGSYAAYQRLEFAKTALAIIKAENRIEMLDNLSQPAV